MNRSTATGGDGGSTTLLLAVGTLVLLSGLGQNLARVAARVLAGRPLDHGVHAWWMTPAGDALFYAPLLLIVLLIERLFPMLRRDAVRWSILLTPFFLTGLMQLPRLHFLASAMLALGLAIRVSSAAASRPILQRRLASSFLPLSALTTAIALPMAIWPVAREARTASTLPHAPAGAPNVLLLIWDTVRAASLDLYGSPVATAPHLTRFAHDGVVFERAISTASYTLPSHASLFTGEWAHDLSTNWRTPLNEEPRTLAEVLAAAGYRTGGFSANRIYVTREFGLDRGFAHFEEHRLGFQQMVRSSTLTRAVVSTGLVRDLLGFYDDLARVHAEQNHATLIRWLERDRSRPFFAFVNFMEGHTPYLPSERFATRFGWYPEGISPSMRREVRAVSRVEQEHLPPEKALRQKAAYEGAIAELDEKVAAMLDDLRARGLLDNTIVIVAADHGEEFGEHALFGHGNSLYFQSLHVPLVIVFPSRIPAGTRVADAVSIRNVAATVLDLAGLSPVLPGRSLRSFWERRDPMIAEPALSEIRFDRNLTAGARSLAGDMMSAVHGDVQVIRNGDGSLEAFDLSADPSGVVTADTVAASVKSVAAQLPAARRQGGARE